MKPDADKPARQPSTPITGLFGLFVIALVLLLAGCGDDDSADSGITSTSNELTGTEATIPDLPVNDDPAAVVCTGPPQGTFDATAVVGDPIGAAKRAAVAEGCQIRVAVRDGEGLALTQDFRPDRINVAIENGAVIEIVNLG